MQRCPTVDPRRLFRFSSLYSFMASAITNVCCRTSSQHPSRPNQKNRRARSSRTGSIPSTWSRIARLVNQLGITLDTKHKTNTNRRLMWRVIPAGDEGRAQGRSIPGGDSDEGRLFSLDPGGGEGATNRCWRGGMPPRRDSARRFGENHRRRTGGTKGGRATEGEGERARAEISLPPTASLRYGAP